MKESIRTQPHLPGAATVPAIGFFLLLLTILFPIRGEAQPFGPGRSVTASADGVEALAAADLDGDGDQDVLAALRGSDTVAWYANDGTGGFGPGQVLSDSADAAADVHAADLDGDGDLDVVAAAGGSGRVTWYENDGTGGFAFGGVVTETAPGVRSVEVADLNNDGRMDVLAAASGADRVAWYPNNTDDTFGAGRVITDTAEGAFSVVADTLAGGAAPDVAVASYGDNTVSIFQNDGTGAFTTDTVTTAAQQARSVRIGDVDGDGTLDLVVASSADSTVAWYPGRGDGTFGAEQVITASADAPYAVHLSDTDGDGALDVVVAAAGSDRVLWYGNDGAGAFGTSEILDRSASIVHAVHAGRLDGDGRPDVLAGSSFDDAVFWYENNPPPSAPSAVQRTRGNREVRLSWARNPEPDLDGYNVYRSSSSFSSVLSATQVNAGLVEDTTFVDTSVTNGTSYFYRLAAVDTSGQEGDLSREVSATPTAGILFVDADAGGANDGTSWTDAYTSLQDALSAATPTSEIWVAEGTYYPDEGTNVTPGDTTASFTLPDSVAVYGGFAGTENERPGRNPRRYTTTLSGDVDQTGTDRSNHVVTAPSTVTRHARLDGFVVRAGRGATNGGGVYVNGGGLTVVRTVFVDNRAVFGGGLRAATADTVIVSHSRFVGNTAADHGGGLSFDGSRLRVLNSVFTGNVSTGGLKIGGAMFLDTGDVEINGTTLAGNRAGGEGGGIYSQTGGSYAITNSVLWADSAGTGNGELFVSGTEPTVTHSLIEGTGGSGSSWVDSLGADGGGNLDQSPHFVSRVGSDGTIGTLDDNVRLADNSPALGAGDGALLPADVLDLDADGDTAEDVPVDLEDEARVQASAVDMGAYEGSVTVPPGVPATLQTGTVTPDSVQLSWRPVDAPDLRSYSVYRSTSPIDSSAGPGSYTPLDSVAAGDTTFTDATVERGETYYYRVAASDDRGNEGGFSEEASAIPASLVIESGLAAYYPFYGNARDASGNGHSGSVNGPVLTSDRFGDRERAYEFDGEDDYINLGRTSSIVSGNAVSISFWVRVDSVVAGNNNQLISSESYYEDYGDLTINQDNYRFYTGNNSYGTLALGQSIQDGGWHQVAVVHDGQTGRLYVDGERVDESSLPDFSANTKNLHVGTSDPDRYQPLDGALDQVRFYDRPLTETEVRRLYAAEGGRLINQPDPPTDLAAASDGQQVTLSWTASDSADVGEYRIYRGTTAFDTTAGPSAYSSLDTVSASKTTYVDDSTRAGTTYYYRVTAVGSTGNESDFADGAQATTPPSVTTIRPTSGAVGTPVRIYGAGFSPTAGENTVRFGSMTATIDSAQSNVLYAQVPSGVRGPVPVSVATNGQSATLAERFSAVTRGTASFKGTGAGLSGVDNGDTDWGDYDGDGDMDLVVVGRDSSGAPAATIYENRNGTLDPLGAQLQGVASGAAEWGDYDGDRDLDLIVVGDTTGTGDPSAFLYRNDDGTFVAADANIAGASGGDVDWGDFDGDGRLDLVVSGDSTGNGDASTVLYQNSGDGAFAPLGAQLTGVTSGAAVWHDYDRDGRLDLVVTGDANGPASSGGASATLYHNEGGGAFAAAGAGLTGVLNGDAAWADYDEDGDPDLVVTGIANDNATPTATLYRQGGTGFTAAGAGLAGVVNGTASWGDIDADAAPELLVAGDTTGGDDPAALLYHNNDGTLALVSTNLRGVHDGSSAAWTDYDADGDLDLVLTGADTTATPTASVYVNGARPPAPPRTLTAALTSRRPALSWTAGTDSAASYRVYRDTTALDTTAGPSAYTALDTLAGSTTSYVDSSTSLGTTYHYRLTSVSAGGDESAFSDPAQIATPIRVTSVRPMSGPAGTPVRIYGAGFGPTASDNTVAFGGAPATVDSVSSSVIYTQVPSGVRGPVPVAVSTPDTTGQSSARFSVLTRGSPFFSPVDAGLGPVSASASAIADVNDDGRLDLLVTGQDSSGLPSATLYLRRADGSFTTAGGGLTGVGSSSVSVADVDGNGLPDILLTGRNKNGNPSTKLYYQDETGSFSAAAAGLPGVADGSSSIADVNGDGRPDLLIAGSQTTTLYLQQPDGAFAAANAGLTGVEGAATSIADVNEDGRPDLLVTGEAVSDQASSRQAVLYLQQRDGSFTPAGDNLDGVENGSSAIADVNGDGRLDVLLTGSDENFVATTTLYLQQPGGAFAAAGAGLTGVNGPCAIADVDADGDLDLLITGVAEDGSVVGRLYQQRADGSFRSVEAGLDAVGGNGSISTGDLGADGALNLLLTGAGADGTSEITLYKNGRPDPPTQLAADRFSDRLTLSWTDSTTASGAAYRVYRDTTTIDSTVGPTAYRAVDTISATRRSYTDTGLAPGTAYYYRVTAVDSSGAESEFSGQLRATTLERDAGVVASYPFDGSAEDTEGDNNGSVVGPTLTTDRGGAAESAYQFDGTDDYIAVGGGDLEGSLSVSLWVRTATAWRNETLIEKPSDWRIGTADSAGIAFQVSGADGNYGVEDTTVASGRWYHVVGVHDAEEGGLRLYLNGVPVDTQETVTRTRSDSTLVIGADGSVDRDFFDGTVDDVRLYSRPLSPGEVRGLYAEGSPLPPAGLAVRDRTEEVRLDWSGDAAPDVTAYRVYRDTVGLDSTAGPGGYTPTATVPAPQTGLTDTTVTPGQTYRYRVTAVDTADAESGFSAEQGVAVRDRPVLAGVAVDSSETGIPLFEVKATSDDTTLTTRADSSGAFTLSGPPGTYEIGGEATSDTTYFSHDSTATAVTLTAGDSSRVALDATTGFHLGLDSVQTSALFPAPGDTVSVTATYEAWSAERAPGASMYAVAGFFGDATEAIPLGTPGTAPGTTGQLRAELPVPSESTLLNGHLWSFVTYVTATSKAEAKSAYESLYPNLDRFIYTGVVFPDDGAPAPPENLSVTDTTGRVELEWTPPAESDLTDLFVYRSKTPIDSSAGPGSLTPYAEVSALDTTFVDTSAVVDSTYYYRVTAGDLLEYESGFSPEAEATVNEPDSLTLAGTVRYYGTSTGVGNVALRLGGNAADTSRTTSDGAFSFDLFARKNYTLSPARPDDAAPARGVTTADLALIRRDVLGTDSLGRYPRLAADADGSSGVSTVDIPLLRRVIQGDATSVPGGLWRFVPTDTDSAKSAFNRRSARRYRDLRADRTGQNFVAIKRGDLDTSWVRTTKKRPAAVSKTSGGRPVVVGLPEREVALQADTVTVPIRARAFEGVGGVQFTLEWDPKVLRLLGTTEYRLPGLSAENMGRTEGETRGLATVVWNEPKGQGHSVAPGDSLFALRYRVRKKGESDLTVTSSVTPRYAHDGETLDARRLRGEAGAITVKAIPDKFALRANYPNPVHHRTTIEYALPEQAPVTLRLYDVLGRRVATVVNETKEAGRHTVQVQATELSSGVYFYRIRAGDFTKTRRMVIVR